MGRNRRDNPPVRLRLTAAGWAFLAGSVLVGVVALNSGLGLLFVLFGCMLGAVHVSAVLSRRMVAAAHVERELPPRCRQNRPVGVSYLLRSVRGGGSCLALHIEEAALNALDAGTRVKGNALRPAPTACGHLPSGQGYVSRTETTPARRGRIRFAAVRLSTTFPFGLVSASRQFAQEATLVVWPARGRLKGALLSKGEADSAAVAPSIRAGGQDEFYGLREYRLGDNARWIHWRRSAGRRELVVREMARPRPRTLWVVLDTYLPLTRRDGVKGLPAGDAGAAARRERAIRFAATVIEDALDAGYRVGAALAYEDKVVVRVPTDRRAQRARLLDALAEIGRNPARRVGEAISRLRPGWLRQAHVIVIGGADEEDPSPGMLSRLRRDCRGLTVVPAPRVGEFFRDDPVAAAQEAG